MLMTHDSEYWNATPKAVGVEIAAAQPAATDSRISSVSVVYLIKMALERLVPRSREWFVYIGEYRVPGWAWYKDGIYFKVFNRQWLEEHQGQPISFRYDDGEIIETGLALPMPAEPDLLSRLGQALTGPAELPTQEEALRQGTS